MSWLAESCRGDMRVEEGERASEDDDIEGCFQQKWKRYLLTEREIHGEPGSTEQHPEEEEKGYVFFFFYKLSLFPASLFPFVS